MDAAHRAELYLESLGQYIKALEADNAALKRDLVRAANGGLCDMCENMPQPPQCYEADFDCAECRDTACRCKGCTGDCEHFQWRGREK